MSYNNSTNDLDFAVGATQLNAMEDDITDVLSGAYDDIMDAAEPETMMDADEDKEDFFFSLVSFSGNLIGLPGNSP